MFIPYVPIVRDNQTINNNILYQDTVLPLKDLGSNIKVTTIDNVSSYSLENCIKTILESNKDIVFNTIQYSKNDNKLYFYTNDYIDISKWKEKNTIKYKQIKNTKEILEEIKTVLVNEKIKDNDVISLANISRQFKKANNDYKSLINNFNDFLEEKISFKYNNSSSIYINKFNYENNTLEIQFKYYGNYDKVIFSKKDNDLYVLSDESFYGKELLSLIGSDLSKIYDELLKYKNYEEDSKYNIKSINSNFLVHLSKYGVSIYTKNNYYQNEFELSSPSYSSDYTCECNSTFINECVKDHEYDILKNIYVKIEDTPSWCQDLLYKMRQNELEIENKLEEKENRKRKLIKTFLPFLNK